MYHYNAKVLRIVDGDTYDMKVDLGFDIWVKTRFRLNGVDTPETWRPTTEAERAHGHEATAAVKEFMEGQMVEITSYSKDKYGRYLCDVEKDGISLAGMLLAKGLAKRESYED
jgi:micrococcal nuclease